MQSKITMLQANISLFPILDFLECEENLSDLSLEP